VLWNVGDVARHVVFPISGVLSIQVRTADRNSVHVGIVGPEGAAGFGEGAGQFAATTPAIFQVPGRFELIPVHLFRTAARNHEEIMRLMEVCIDWLLLQSQQIAACNARHSASARICRWLLTASELTSQEFIAVTQETLARALGIRRTTATLLAQQLQAEGLISYRRGKIVVRDRSRLQQMACDCIHVLGRSRWPSEQPQTPSAVTEEESAA
jgi:CRP-like cAMP-binding protein